MNTLFFILLAFVVLIAALTVPVAIRDRRRASAGYAGRRLHPSPYDGLDGVSPDGGGGFDAGGGDGGGGGT